MLDERGDRAQKDAKVIEADVYQALTPFIGKKLDKAISEAARKAIRLALDEITKEMGIGYIYKVDVQVDKNDPTKVIITPLNEATEKLFRRA